MVGATLARLSVGGGSGPGLPGLGLSGLGLSGLGLLGPRGLLLRLLLCLAPLSRPGGLLLRPRGLLLGP